MFDVPFEALLDPSKYGYKECDHCNGYGSSLKDPIGQNVCSKCGGVGLIKAKTEDNNA